MPIIRQSPNMAGTGSRSSLSFTRGGTLVPRTAPVTPGAPATPVTNLPPTPPAPGNSAASQPLSQQGAPRDPRLPVGNGIDPVDVNVGQPTLDSFQQHQDAAYQQATRTLDPMWEANKRRFDQDMINRGITPGSEAYDLALAQHDRARTDAYDSAQRNAVEAGQRAQQQAFQQNYMESELANQLLRQREGNQTSIDVAGIGAGASMYGQDINRQNFMDQLGFNQQQAGIANSQWDRQFDQSLNDWNRQGNQWDRQFGLGQQNSDFNQMMQMMGFDRDSTNMQNQQGNQQFAQLMSLFGMIPQAQGSQPIDYMGALGMNQNQQNANYQTGVNSANQNNAQYAAILASLFCDENAKDLGEPVDTAKCMEIAESLPLVHFAYKGSDVPCVGTTAQAFNIALHGAPDTQIKVIDLLGVLLGAVKHLSHAYHAQADELKKLRAA
jgi:hypothetical protein